MIRAGAKGWFVGAAAAVIVFFGAAGHSFAQSDYTTSPIQDPASATQPPQQNSQTFVDPLCDKFFNLGTGTAKFSWDAKYLTPEYCAAVKDLISRYKAPGPCSSKGLSNPQVEGITKLNPEFALALDKALRGLGISVIITSAYRTPEGQTCANGSASDSSHIHGCAVDLAIERSTCDASCQKIRSGGSKYGIQIRADANCAITSTPNECNHVEPTDYVACKNKAPNGGVVPGAGSAAGAPRGGTNTSGGTGTGGGTGGGSGTTPQSCVCPVGATSCTATFDSTANPPCTIVNRTPSQEICRQQSSGFGNIFALSSANPACSSSSSNSGMNDLMKQMMMMQMMQGLMGGLGNLTGSNNQTPTQPSTGTTPLPATPLPPIPISQSPMTLGGGTGTSTLDALIAALRSPSTSTFATTPIACPLDSKSCPDGSTVSRIPPSCQFTPCPVTASTNVGQVQPVPPPPPPPPAINPAPINPPAPVMITPAPSISAPLATTSVGAPITAPIPMSTGTSTATSSPEVVPPPPSVIQIIVVGFSRIPVFLGNFFSGLLRPPPAIR